MCFIVALLRHSRHYAITGSKKTVILLVNIEWRLKREWSLNKSLELVVVKKPAALDSQKSIVSGLQYILIIS